MIRDRLALVVATLVVGFLTTLAAVANLEQVPRTVDILVLWGGGLLQLGMVLTWALFPPAVAEMVTSPPATVVTRPLASTVARALSDDDHVIGRSTKFSSELMGTAISLRVTPRSMLVLGCESGFWVISTRVTSLLGSVELSQALAAREATPTTAAVASRLRMRRRYDESLCISWGEMR